MSTRREFLKAGAAAAAFAAARPLHAWQGANNRVRMAVIGMGGRSARVFDSLTRNQDCQFVAGCEVVQTKLQAFQSPNRPRAHGCINRGCNINSTIRIGLKPTAISMWRMPRRNAAQKIPMRKRLETGRLSTI